MTEPMRLRMRAGAPLKAVHHALTDPGSLRAWLAEHAEVDPPHRYAFWGPSIPEGDRARQTLLRLDDTTLRFGWTLDGEETTVELALEEETPETTIVTLAQSGLPSWDEMFDAKGSRALVATFWALALANLADHLEGRPTTPRCDFTSPVMREEVMIDASPRAVYDSIMDPAAFARWFGVSVEIDPRIGGDFAMGGADHPEPPLKIVDLVPGSRVSLRWDDGTVASWELEGSEGRTRLTFTQSGFDASDPPYGAWMGWLSGIGELRRYHELDGWRPIWTSIELTGMPEGMISYE
ncbi:SRPBCC domain-containing protein [Spirillospora sp. CA-294931]|uniref:SRPBCC domain-containing protein n=1 Tax=Spirillospora sp. CA-294931 TaxID=3240042 RepID=UPI003D8D5CC5